MSACDAIVLGSGPSGVACAKALVAGGATVRVVDVGRTLEPGARDVFDALAATEPARWPDDLDRRARDSLPATTRGVPNKSVYGSYFPYTFDEPDLPLTMRDAEVVASFARGGLSNVWGASMLPYRDVDISGWPIRVADLAPHYRAVLDFVPLAGEVDELAGQFPLFTESPHRLARTPQIARVLAHLRAHADALHASGIAFGGSRLAVTSDPGDAAHCRLCGLCMYGCPYDAIYSSAQTLEAMVCAGEVTYLPGLHADHVGEKGGVAHATCHEVGRPARTTTLSADRIFVACGYVSSTRIVLASTGRAQVADLADSLYFLTPMLMRRGARATAATQGNTFAQAYLEVDAPGLLDRTAHLQIYGYSDIMLKAASAHLARRQATSERYLQPVLGRLLAVQGFLHSDDSPGLSMRVVGSQVELTGHGREHGEATVHRLVRHLARHGRALGMVPIPTMTQIGLPGKSFHTGGSLPMSADPHGLQSDLLGRPAGYSRIHVVDTSVLPSVPGTTITLTAMANAHRIGTAALRLADSGVDIGGASGAGSSGR